MDIGIIGLGDMGCLYARSFAKAGYTVLGADLPGRREELEAALGPLGIRIAEDGNEVSRRCDVIFYSVEAEKIRSVVQQFGGATRYGAIVAGQTSVKHPEIAAFEEFLPADVNIITVHSLHGPGVDPQGQKLIVIPHRTTAEAFRRMTDVLSALTPDLAEIPDYREHDRIVADTQAATHMGFECMGTAWKEAGFFPWENDSYVGGIDHVKILTTLRIFSYKAHIYAGLAILNPYASGQVRQYARSESELFKMMIREDAEVFRKRVLEAGQSVFRDRSGPLMLPDDLMQEYALSSGRRKPNSHLSLLSMVDAWHRLGIRPYDHLICQTPPFRLRLGIAEYLFRNPDLLEESIETALYDKSIRADDLEFHSAVREWASLIGYGDMAGYRSHFNAVRTFFEGRLEQGRSGSAELIRRIQAVHALKV